jgi:hypothetical protein
MGERPAYPSALGPDPSLAKFVKSASLTRKFLHFKQIS